MRGRLYILSGPAGVGKGTVLRRVFEKLDNIAYSVSCTTRTPRPGERDGTDYVFMDEASFKKMVSEERFLEWANVHGHFYGTRKDVVEDILNSGRDVVLEIDVQGASQVKKKMPEAVMIFIQPPSFEELVRRLRKRGTEGPEEFELRILNAKEEMSHAGEYEHMIINDKIEQAADDLIKIVKKYREGLI